MPISRTTDQANVLRVELHDLLRDQHELEIVHAGRIYRLRLTASGKLILTA
jgi:hemin uptake protein HemP